MDETEALEFLADHARMYGAMKGFERLGERMKVSPNTIYGWHRRSAIPAWRLPAFNAFRKRKRKAA